MYSAVDEELKQLRANRASLTADEFALKEVEIEEKRSKIKRRMLGNIRFVGELYKKKLLNTETMHDCINQLLGSPGAWKTTHDEQDLDMLCRLLTTLGETLESKSKKSKSKDLAKNFDAYFVRLKELTKDMTLNSRTRFTIEEVIALRDNNWQSRKMPEGPMKIAELHQKLAQSEQTKARPPPMPTLQSGGGNNNKSILPRSGDVRNLTGNKPPVLNRFDTLKDSASAKSDKSDKSDKKPAPAKSTPSTAQSKPLSTSPVVEPVSFDFAGNSALRRKVKASLEEFVHGVDVNELNATLKEDQVICRGLVVMEMLDKFQNMTDAAKRSRILGAFDNEEFCSILLESKNVVEASLEAHEAFKNLVDSTLDAKEVGHFE